MPRTVRDVMTHNPVVLPATATVIEAARAMRDNDIGDVIVGDDSGNVIGILTDRDIVVRPVADGSDPTSVTVRDICSIDLDTLSPDDTVGDAVRIMQANAIRRLPVLEDGKAVGVVSLGDLAVEGPGEAALDDISAATPNN
jgi:CBS domain-containing protein